MLRSPQGPRYRRANPELTHTLVLGRVRLTGSALLSATLCSATLLSTVLLSSLLVAPRAFGQSDDPAATRQTIDQIVERYAADGASVESVNRAWVGCRELEQIDDDEVIVAWGREGLRDERATVRLMASKTLLAIDEDKGVEATLQRLAAADGQPEPVRTAALELLGQFDSTKTIKLLTSVLEGVDAYQPSLRFAAARALFENSSEYSKVRESLVPLLEVDDIGVRTQAALTLGEMGYLEGRIKRALRMLAKEPTREGSRARLVLSQDLLMRRLERISERGPGGTTGNTTELSRKLAEAERKLSFRERKLKALQRDYNELRDSLGRDNYTHPVFGDLIARIKARYVDPSLVDDNELVIAAAKGMVQSLDRFSRFMDPKDTQQFEQDISGEYAGIGARVARDRDTDSFIIVRPIYSGPAYEAGLQSNDRIVEVEGLSTRGLTMEDLIKDLKGKPNTPVSLKIMRRGWREAREFSIPRRVIRVNSAHSEMLPGMIGYIHLAQFGDTSVTEVTQALDRLLALGMKGLVLDLRDNPGGYLSAAVKIVDAFVGEQSDPIVTQRGKGNGTRSESQFPTAEHKGDFPLTVLVNSSSASASEIVSGALQDYKRATIVGEKSFGKGSVQRLLPLPDGTNDLLGGETTLRLTVQYYYLPSGRSIHTQRDREGRIVEKGGVEPDVAIPLPEIALWRMEAINKLRDAEAFDQYLDAHFTEHRDALEKIADRGDGGSSDPYPGFDEFFAEKNTVRADPDDLRRELRRVIRLKVQDARGQEYASDYAEDIQLQGAIRKLLQDLGLKVSDIPEYSKL